MPGPAATISHMHTCPMWDGKSPHVGGPIIGPGVPTVLIGGKPAAVMGDQCTCSGPPDVIAMGVATVLFGGKPAATMGDKTAHGGIITVGEPTVLIGTGGSAPTAVMPVSKIPFPKIKLINKILGNNKQAIANQEQLKKESESTEAEPRIYGVKWVVGEQIIREHKVFKEITVTAHVINIPDGESLTFSIKRPTKTTDEEGNAIEKDDDIIELTGTVEDKKVEVTWEIEKAPETEEEEEEEEEETTPSNQNSIATNQTASTIQENSVAEVPENNNEETEEAEKKVVVFFIGGAGDKESFYGTGPTKIVDSYVKKSFDSKITKNYTSFYLGYNEVRGDDDLQKFVYNKIDDKENTAIYIVGHSLGGWNGAHLSQILTDGGYTVDLLITLDPVGTGSWVSPIGVKVFSDIYKLTPNPKANYWINISTEPEEYAADDFVADTGGQWLPENNEKCNIFHKTKYSHGWADKMFNENLKDTNISASQMLLQYINEFLK